MLGRRSVVEDPDITLARCIGLVDDLRAYRRKDLEQIDARFDTLKKSRFKEAPEAWQKARPAAQRIVDMPLQIPGAKETINRLAWLKVVNRVFLIFVVILVAALIVPVWRRALGPDFLGGLGIYYAGFFVVLVVASMNLGNFWDYRLRRKIIAYEEQTMDRYAGDRDKMKECVSRMMRTLAREIDRAKKDPNHYALVLYFDDYTNIEVVNKWKPRSMFFFKKSYNYYHIVPKV